MTQLDSTKALFSWATLIIIIAAFIHRRVGRQKTFTLSPKSNTPTRKKHEPEYSESAYYEIEPLERFDINKEDPVKIRPFKSRYHLTMAIENTTMADLVAMDKTYLDRINLRRTLIQQEGEDVLALNPKAEPAVKELYDWMTTIYLPRRFPTLFKLSPSSLNNQITGEDLPIPVPSAKIALEILGRHIDDDFLFLLPSSDPTDENRYRLEAFVTCFPSGFNTRQKLGLRLNEIHGPVPGYAQKLERSMDKFFASIPVGRIVKRANWSVTTHKRLFCLSGNHISEAEEQALEHDKHNTQSDGGQGPTEDFDLADTVLRCERQTLHRLPKTKALVFAFKTYQYDLQELKDEGSGEQLADAIEGLGDGNVSGMRVYKRSVVWGDKVKRFLRGQA